VKCERCWRYVAAVSSEPAWAGLCERCRQALAADREVLDPSARKPTSGGALPARGDESSAGAWVGPGAGKDING